MNLKKIILSTEGSLRLAAEGAFNLFEQKEYRHERIFEKIKKNSENQ